MPLLCGPNQFAGHLLRHGDAQDAAAAYDIAQSFAIAHVKRLVRDFAGQQSCPTECPTRHYDPRTLSIDVRRVWGGPSPDYPGLYRVVVQADYRFEIACDPAAPPLIGADEPPQPVDLLPPAPPAEYRDFCLKIACAHFCTFKEGGSDTKYVHVHITLPIDRFPPGPHDITGVGHDDRTNPNHPRHNTVSRGTRCGFETKPDRTTIQPPDWGLRYYLTIYFIEAPPDGCPEGFSRHECPCGTMCYTFHHATWERWHMEHVVGH